MGLDYKQEFVWQVADEIKPLLDMHWRDIATNKDVIKLNPDWEAYHSLEGQGKLKVFTARDAGTLVGYFVVLVGHNIHYKDHLFAANDIIYLHKDHRKGFAGIRLINFAEKCLTADGVSTLTINTKVHQPFDAILERMKYKLVERVYSKYLQGRD